MMERYSPGPWEWVRCGDMPVGGIGNRKQSDRPGWAADDDEVLLDANGDVVVSGGAEGDSGYCSGGACVGAADAALIAAAPEMLDVLRRVGLVVDPLSIGSITPDAMTALVGDIRALLARIDGAT